MRPLILTLEAFGPFAKETVLDFRELGDHHIFAITGPTGAGKSTIFEGMYYALYGALTSDTRNPKELKSDFALADAEAKVSFSFLVDGKRWAITRKPPQDILKKNGEGFRSVGQEVELTSLDDVNFKPLTKVTEVNEKIESLIGLNKEQFKKIIMIPQGQFKTFLSAKTDVKQEILRNLFDTSFYRNIQEIAKESAKTMKDAYGDTDKDIQRYLEQLEGIDLVAAEVNPRKILGEYLKASEKQVKNAQDAAIDARKERDQVLKEVNAFRHKWELEEKLQMLLAQKADVAAKKIQANALKDDLVEIEKAQRVERFYDRYLRSQIEEEKAQNTYQTSISQHESALTAKNHALEKQNALKEQKPEIERKKDERNRLLERIEEYKVLKPLENQLEVEKRQLKVCEEAIKNTESKIIQYKKRQVEVATAQEKQMVLQKELSDLKDALSALKQKIELLRHIYSLKEKLDQEERRITEIQKLYAVKQKTAQKAQEEWETARRLVQQNQASALARTLHAHEPCPVCGSLEHPHPETAATVEVDENAAFIKWQKAQDEAHQVASDLNTAQDRLKTNFSQLETELQEEAAQDLKLSPASTSGDILEQGKALRTLYDAQQVQEKQLLADQATCLKKINNKKDIDNALETAEKKQKALEEERWAYREKVTTLETQLAGKDLMISEAALLQQQKDLEKAITAYEQALEDAQSEYQKFSNALAAAASLLDSGAKTLQARKEEKEVAEKEFLAKVTEYFPSQIDFEVAYNKLDQVDNMRQELEKLIESYETWQKDVEYTQAERGEEVLPEKTVLDATADRVEKEYDAALSHYATMQDNLKQHQDVVEKIEGVLRDQADLKEKVQITNYLSRALSGDNDWRMDLETFVLAHYFLKILEQANIRLRDMTAGRYSFARQVNPQDKRGLSGLGLDVMDAYTSKPRDVASLSGGESFKASLALALGLADVVAAESKSRALDTIFIDEGFGTLDQESLDQTMDVLLSLEEGGRLVGVISHVEELKNRMDARLMVQPMENGSRAYFDVPEI